MAFADGPAPPFDPEIFSQAIDVPALLVSAQHVGKLQKDGQVKAMLFRRRNLRNVLPVDGAADSAQRLVLFQLGTQRGDVPGVAKQLLESGVAEFVTHQLRLGYRQTTAEEALQRLLPKDVEIPRGFETVGHLAHFNLKESQWPHRQVIGRVILDKNPCLKTVVTKVGSLSNEFRTFEMEVIAGNDDTEVQVREQGLTLEFDFRKVYWNSRLSEERVRLLKQIRPEDVVCDLFAGVGAFALLCARHGCLVHANDLNPAGAEAMRRNAGLNRLDISVYNMDARKCVQMIGRLPELSAKCRVHVIMNLPELALDFLDCFREMLEKRESALFSSSPVELMVHCYCFARDKDTPEADIHPRLVAALGQVPEGTVVREVRDVAPKKNMYCVEFCTHLNKVTSDASKRQRTS